MIAITVDIIVFSIVDNCLCTLLVKRKNAPFKGMWAIPGGFVEENEQLKDAAARELWEETGVQQTDFKQLYAFDDLGRDPRGRTITVAHLAFCSKPLPIRAASDAEKAQWMNIYALPSLAFDHKNILSYALEYLKNEIENGVAAFQLLSKEFTLLELQRVYEIVLNKKLDKQHFQTQLSNLDVLVPLDLHQRDEKNKSLQLFKFSLKKFQQLKNKKKLFIF